LAVEWLTVVVLAHIVEGSGAKGRGPEATKDGVEWHVALRFVGRYEHSLDVKGRIILPARFRTSFDTLAFLSKHNERCLALWTPESFDTKADQMEAIQDRSPEDRQIVRAWASGSAEVEIDRQGRLAIPAYLREYARLETAVLVHGAINHIELWDPAEWEIRGAPGDAGLADPVPSRSRPDPGAPPEGG
jgi:MraZ protein